jgi:hypothetical protein
MTLEPYLNGQGKTTLKQVNSVGSQGRFGVQLSSQPMNNKDYFSRNKVSGTWS